MSRKTPNGRPPSSIDLGTVGMHLQDLWFIAIAVLWTGYFFLEGFDFGVGMLLPVLGRAEDERRALISTIGPVWDGNEVWLIVAVLRLLPRAAGYPRRADPAGGGLRVPRES
jgi:cytochrome bd-type quinol oxidase subunit 2